MSHCEECTNLSSCSKCLYVGKILPDCLECKDKKFLIDSINKANS